MWFLRPINISNPPIRLLANEDIVIGRNWTESSSSIQIPHNSVSRRHAILRIHHPISALNNPAQVPKLTLEDCSKLGSFVNAERYIKTTVELSNDDVIIFGAAATQDYRVVYEPLVACTSCLIPEEKVKLQADILRLGGHLVPDWSDVCTFLCMSRVTVTVKAISCLLSCRNIVTPNFFTNLIAATADEHRVDVVQAESYVPELNEESIDGTNVDLRPNDERKTLFRFLKFYFLSERQEKKFSALISLGGGQSVVLHITMPFNMSMLDDCLSNGFVLMKPDVTTEIDKDSTTAVTSRQLRSISGQLKKNGRRMVPDTEISLAVLFCSIDQYCNPCYTGFGSDPDKSIRASSPSLPFADDFQNPYLCPAVMEEHSVVQRPSVNNKADKERSVRTTKRRALDEAGTASATEQSSSRKRNKYDTADVGRPEQTYHSNPTMPCHGDEGDREEVEDPHVIQLPGIVCETEPSNRTVKNEPISLEVDIGGQWWCKGSDNVRVNESRLTREDSVAASKVERPEYVVIGADLTRKDRPAISSVVTQRNQVSGPNFKRFQKTNHRCPNDANIDRFSQDVRVIGGRDLIPFTLEKRNIEAIALFGSLNSSKPVTECDFLDAEFVV